MRKFTPVHAMLAFAVAGCGTDAIGLFRATESTTGALVDGQAIPGEFIVQVKPGRVPVIKGGKVVSTLDLGKQGRFYLVRAENLAGAAMKSALASDPAVVTVGPNRHFQVPVSALAPRLPALVLPQSSDPLYGQQWYLPHIGADRAWPVTRGSGVVTAVVDTGVDYNHPDLKASMVGPGYSFVDNKPDAIDVFGHGTHVAGIVAAAANNGKGVSGVAPETKILPVGVLAANGGGSLFTIASGIKYAADYGPANDVHVIINLSLGGPATAIDPISTAVGKYATAQGALPVAAAGNSNTAVGTPAQISQYYMAVSAINQKDQKASFSNFGPEISVGAPGVDIMNTTPTYKCPLNEHGYAQNYAALKGTSMAAPVVSGACALVWSIHKDWTWKQVREQVEKTALDLGQAGRDDVFGYGLVQPSVAVGGAR